MKKIGITDTLILKALTLLSLSFALFCGCSDESPPPQESVPKAYITTYKLVISDELDQLAPIVSELWDSISAEIPSVSLELLRYSDQIAGELFLSGELRANGWINFSKEWSQEVQRNSKPLTERFKDCETILSDTIEIGFHNREGSSTLHALEGQSLEQALLALYETPKLKNSLRYILPNPEIESTGVEVFRMLGTAFTKNPALRGLMLRRISQLSPSSRAAVSLAERTSKSTVPIVITSAQRLKSSSSLKRIKTEGEQVHTIFGSLCISDSPWLNATQKVISSRLKRGLLNETSQDALRALGYANASREPQSSENTITEISSSVTDTLETVRKVSPLELTIVSDLSGNIGNYQLYLQKAILRQLLTTNPWQSRLSVIAVDGIEEVRITHTKENANSSSKAIESMRRSGQQDLFDTILYAANHIGERTKRAPNHRHALLVLSDGTDTNSKASFVDLKKRLQQLQTAVGLLPVFILLPQEGGEQSSSIHRMLELAHALDGESINISKDSLPLHIQRLQRVFK